LFFLKLLKEIKLTEYYNENVICEDYGDKKVCPNFNYYFFKIEKQVFSLKKFLENLKD